MSVTTGRARWLWVFCAILGTGTFVALALFATIEGVPLALSSDNLTADFRGLADAQIWDGETLAGLRTSAHVLATSAEGEAAGARWVASFSPAISWIPSLDRQVYAWAAQVERLDRDLAIASDLIHASLDLLAAFEDAGSALLAVQADSPGTTQSLSVADMESTFAFASMRLDDVEGYRQRMPVLRLPRLSRALETLVEAEDDMRFASEIGLAGTRLLIDLLAVGENVRPLLGLLTDGAIDGPTITYDDLVASLQELGGLADSATQQSASLAAMIKEGGEGLGLQDKLTDLQVVLGALQNIGGAAGTGLGVLGPVLQFGGTGLFGEDGSMIAAVDLVNHRLEEVVGAVDRLEGARQALGQVSLPGAGAARLDDLVAMVVSLRDGLQLLVEMAPLGRELLGADGPRRYLVMGHSADELRATGGFVSTLWLVTIENGAVLDVRYHDIVRVDDLDRLALYPPAPPGLAAHMNAKVWLFRDVSWEPDFPTVAKTAIDMYKIGQRQAVDGVVAINQWTLLGMIGALGSIAGPGESGKITPKNLLARLEEGSDKFGRSYADLALQGVLEKLNQPLSLGSLIKVASAVQASLRSRDLMVYLDDDEDQEKVRRAGWDGGLGGQGTDYLYVVDSNVGWSKVDRNIERRLRYEVDFRKGPGARATLTMSYSNHSGPGSPGCEPQWLNRGTNYTQLKNACYWDFWRVYTPQGSRLLGNTPLELPLYSVSAEIGIGQSGEDTVGVSSSYDKNVLSGLFALGAGEQIRFTMVYDLPSDAVSRIGGNIEYELVVQKQPGSRGSDMTLELVLPTGYRLATSSIPPAFSDDSRIGFDFRVEQDTIFSAVLISNDESR